MVATDEYGPSQLANEMTTTMQAYCKEPATQMSWASPASLLSAGRPRRHASLPASTENRPNPEALTRTKNATMNKALLCTFRVHESRVNHIHLSGCWTSLGRLAKQGRGERCWLQMNAEALEPLVQGTVRAAREMGARELANVAYGAACSGSGESLGALFAALARVA